MSCPKLLYFSNRVSIYGRWESILSGLSVEVLRANDLSLFLMQHDPDDIDIVAVEGTGYIQDDADLCRQLRQRFDVPILLAGTYTSEDAIVAAYKAGAGVFISDAGPPVHKHPHGK
jgi:DNA-binding response OmpR family regulator